MPRSCAEPGCGVALSEQNRSGVCSWHMHGQHCGCRPCLLRRNVEVPPAASAEPQASNFLCPRACRALWAEVLTAAIADGAYDLAQARKRGADMASVERRLRAYFASPDCADVAAMAGIDLLGADRVEALMKACERRSYEKTSPAAHV